MPRPGKEFGERSNDDIIREILREHASRENPIGRKEIIKHVIEICLKSIFLSVMKRQKKSMFLKPCLQWHISLA